MLFVSFERPSTELQEEATSTGLFSVGSTFFSPLRAEDVELSVSTGVTAIRVLSSGSGCGTGVGHENLQIVFDPVQDANTGAMANADVYNGQVQNVYMTRYGSGLSGTTVTATVDSDSCQGVELEVVIGGLEYAQLNSPKAQGYSSAPTVILTGGGAPGATDFVPAQLYATASDWSQPDMISLDFLC